MSTPAAHEPDALSQPPSPSHDLGPQPGLTQARERLQALAFFASLVTLAALPLLVQGREIAHLDSLLYYRVFFHSPHLVWDRNIFGGYPVHADPQTAPWYPVQWLCRMLGSWNSYVLAAPLLAGLFTSMLARALGQSRAASLLAGTAYSLGGFMSGHLEHTSMVHAAAWLPLWLWSWHALRGPAASAPGNTTSASKHPGAAGVWAAGLVGSLAVAMTAHAGHLQVLVHGSYLGAAFALHAGRTAPCGPRRHLLRCTLSYLLGVGLAATTLVPTALLAHESIRSAPTYELFTSLSLRLKDLELILAPFVQGGVLGLPFSGDANVQESSAWQGALTPLLACLALLGSTRAASVEQARARRFWGAVLTLAPLLCLGGFFDPLSRMVWHLPLLGSFRVPARHLLELNLALALLAAQGLDALRDGRVSPPQGRRALLMLAAVAGAAALAIWLGLPRTILGPQRMTVTYLLAQLPTAGAWLLSLALLWHALSGAAAPSGTQPASAALPTSARWQQHRLAVALLAADLVASLWVRYGHADFPTRAQLTPPPLATAVLQRTATRHERVLPLAGNLAPLDALVPSVTTLWGIANASGYTPLSLARPGAMLSMGAEGIPGSPWPLWPAHRGLDLLGVRFVTDSGARAVFPEAVPDRGPGRAYAWNAVPFDILLGSRPGCQPWVDLEIPAGTRAQRLALASSLVQGLDLAQGVTVASFEACYADGTVQRLPLRAGLETADQERSSPEGAALCQHSAPQVLESFDGRSPQGKAQTCSYLAYFALRDTPLRRLRLRWEGAASSPACIAVHNVVGLDGDRSFPIARALPRKRFARVATEQARRADEGEPTPRAIGLYENRQVLPPAWVVPAVLKVAPDEALAAVQTSRLPDRTTFAPQRIALVEELRPELEPLATGPPATAAPAAREEGNPIGAQGEALPVEAQVTHLSDTLLQVRSASPRAGLLVVGEVYHPGWSATVDGMPATVHRVDYALRGVVVPGGTHRVELRYTPPGDLVGRCISLLALAAALAGLAWRARQP